MESKKFFPPSKSTHWLAIHTSHTELYRDVSSFSLHLSLLTHLNSEASLLSELFMMILHVSPDDLQRFAGKFGEIEARKAGEEFSDWAKTAEARTAVWHAGQVFRAAKALMPAKNRGFNSIALYFASLTLWVYGLMTSASHMKLGTSYDSQIVSGASLKDRVCLNGVESQQTQLFRSNAHGVPGIMVLHDEIEQFTDLKNPDKVLDAARQLYKENVRQIPSSNQGYLRGAKCIVLISKNSILSQKSLCHPWLRTWGIFCGIWEACLVIMVAECPA